MNREVPVVDEVENAAGSATVVVRVRTRIIIGVCAHLGAISLSKLSIE